MSATNPNSEKQYRFSYLYNSLALFAMSYDNLMRLDGPAFDIEFELESEFEIGFADVNIDYLYNNKIIPQNIKEELLDFKTFISVIPGSLWAVDEFKTNGVWEAVRRKANAMLNLLEINDREYDFSNTKIYLA